LKHRHYLQWSFYLLPSSTLVKQERTQVCVEKKIMKKKRCYVMLSHVIANKVMEWGQRFIAHFLQFIPQEYPLDQNYTKATKVYSIQIHLR